MSIKTGSKFIELKEMERKARKQIIIESALLLFAKKPFYDVGMRDIADEAGVSPATLYRYFPSQEALFNEAFLQNISSVNMEFVRMNKSEKPASIEECAIAFVDHLIHNESSFQMMAYLMLKDDLTNPVMGEFDSITKIVFDVFAELFGKCGFKKDIRIYTHSFVASLTGIIMTFRNHPRKNKELTRDHILRLTRITSKMYEQLLLC